MITDLDEAEEQYKRLTEEAYRLSVLNNKLEDENKRLNELLNLRNPFNSDVEVEEEQQLNAKAALEDQAVRNDKLVAALTIASKALSELDQLLKAEDEELSSVKAKFTGIHWAPGSKRFQDDLTAQLSLKQDLITSVSSALESTKRLLSESEGKAHKMQQDLVELFCKVKLAMLPIPDSENGAINDLKLLMNGKDKVLDEMKNDNRQLSETCETLKAKLEQEGHDKNILNTKVQSLEMELARLRVPPPTVPSNFPGCYIGNYQQQRMPNNMLQNRPMFGFPMPPQTLYQQMPPTMMNHSQPPPAPAHDISLAFKMINMQMQLDQLKKLEQHKQNGFEQKQ